MTVFLGDHVDLLTGYPFESAQYSDKCDDVLLLRGDNIGQGWLRWDGAKRWSKEELKYYGQFLLQPGDVILAMDRPWIEAGLKWAYIGETDEKFLLVQRVARMRGTNGLLTDFLRYLIGSPAFTDHVLSITTGVNVPHISARDIKSFRFELPTIDIQRRIADILIAYDDLIEVNIRRIAILNEMARRIFDAWMQEAEADHTASVPLPISELVTDSLGGDWGEECPQDDKIEAVRVIRGTDIPDLLGGNFVRCPTRYISTKSYSKRALTAGDLVVENSINAKSRAAGTTFLVTKQIIDALGGRTIAASFCRVFKTKNARDAAFLLSDMMRMHRSKDIERFQVVAANGIANFQSKRFLVEHIVRFPRDQVRRENLGSLLSDLNSSTLAASIDKLRASRSLLLSKLISGEIDLQRETHRIGAARVRAAAE